MEIREDIVIVGAGIAGLATSLALHRLGLRSIVLESSDSLRVAGFALSLWTNAWRALDALGIGDALRQHYTEISGYNNTSRGTSLSFADLILNSSIKSRVECRCVQRKELLEILEKELPRGTIRYSSKVVSIEESGYLKLVHLADDTLVKSKVLIGCDGVNSLVAKWLGLQKPIDSGRSAIRGFVRFPEGHGYKPMRHVYFSGGVRFGFLPCDSTCLYWFFTFRSSNNPNDEDIRQNPLKMKQFVASKMENAPKEVLEIVKRTELQRLSCSRLKLRMPWNIVLGNIVKDNVCVAGDALHPMTPDISQGGCSALEDSIVLARCIAECLLATPKGHIGVRGNLNVKASTCAEPSLIGDEQDEDGDEYKKIKLGLEKYAKQRRWRSFSLVTTAYLVGFLQQSDGKVMRLLREKLLSKWSATTLLRVADYDCGHLVFS